MLYSMIPASMLIINLILNWESLKKYGLFEKGQIDKKRVPVRYNYFILSAGCYFIVDMTWALLYEHHEIPILFPLIYSLTVFYFLFMLLTMLTWTRYLIAYKELEEAARLLCDIFVHSPVFRIGGDEFAVFLQGNDYTSRHELMDKLRSQVLENKRTGTGVILASGMSEYQPQTDSFVSDIFERADKKMYENKQSLKA